MCASKTTGYAPALYKACGAWGFPGLCKVFIPDPVQDPSRSSRVLLWITAYSITSTAAGGVNDVWELQLEGISTVIFTCLSTAGLCIFFTRFPPVCDLTSDRRCSLVIFCWFSLWIYLLTLPNYSYLHFSLLKQICISCSFHRQFLLSFNGFLRC